MKQPLIILTGPTASGKTALSVELAKRIGGEIISADSMQVYRHMDVGSAKVTKEEMCGIPHHLIDVLDPKDAFNVVVFQQLAKSAMEEIYQNGHIPIIAGGTGFYIQALLYDIDFTENDSDMEYRRHLEKLAADQGADVLHTMLRQVDPESADAIHANNIKRVIRALEFYEKTGRKISEHNEEERGKDSPYNFAYYVLNMDRKILYDRIDRRVDLMFEHGLEAEVLRLKDMGCTRDMVSMQGLGYKEVLDYLCGEISLAEASYIIKRDTRHFAKRQLTWFKREKDVTWINQDEFDFKRELILEWMTEDLKKRGIIWN
ncbi:MAG: tRNA (adenosine(37)-N6)-dimethylallyltransferase MiaA [Lachnospiraceae bacterium]|nr:tRNA (adenosine(37)-N6)-dimethylallyltransferase MiaA [Lachnospiraceae bacterium]